MCQGYSHKLQISLEGPICHYSTITPPRTVKNCSVIEQPVVLQVVSGCLSNLEAHRQSNGANKFFNCLLCGVRTIQNGSQDHSSVYGTLWIVVAPLLSTSQCQSTNWSGVLTSGSKVSSGRY